MERLQWTWEESGPRIEGFPDGIRVIRLEGQRARRLSDLDLHRADLDFTLACLDEMQSQPHDSRLLQEALWRSSIVHFLKCFGDSAARFRLFAKDIYGAEPLETMAAFDYFKTMRNKHLVHDENSYAQSVPGAILNRGDKPFKIEKILCFSITMPTLDAANYDNLRRLVYRARDWVVEEFDRLSDLLAAELEEQPYDALLERDALTFRVPTPDDVGENRTQR